MLEGVAVFLVLGGLAMLALAAGIIRLLITELPAKLLRRDWTIFLAFVVFFSLSYVTYLVLFTGQHDRAGDLVVPVIFFSGGSFVAVVARLMRRTAHDLQRISVLEVQSTTDALTGVANRRAFDTQWNKEVARARRFRLPLTLLMLDIDHFKKVNDTYGHAAGDKALAAVAKLISGALRETDTVARYGGEEFAVIASTTKPAGVTRLAERIREEVAQKARRAIPGLGESEKITVSIGVAGCNNAADGCEHLFEHADEALFSAKRAGRNRVAFAAPAVAAAT